MSAISRDGAGWPGSNDRGEERCPRMMMLKKKFPSVPCFCATRTARRVDRARAFMALKQRDRNLLLKYNCIGRFRCLPPRVVALRPALVRGSTRVPCRSSGDPLSLILLCDYSLMNYYLFESSAASFSFLSRGSSSFAARQNPRTSATHKRKR